MHTIEQRQLSSLKAAAQNSRTHTDQQIDQIAASISKFGWTIPVLIDEKNTIIAGHARVRAAQRLGMDEAPCIVATGWSEDMKEAYQITDNRLSELSEWDTDILSDQIKRLNAAQFDLSFLDMSGFDMELFTPNLDPKLSIGDVTSGQVGAAKEAQDGKFASTPENTKQSYEVICPHCGEDFEVTL